MASWGRKLNSSPSWRPRMTPATLTVGSHSYIFLRRWCFFMALRDSGTWSQSCVITLTVRLSSCFLSALRSIPSLGVGRGWRDQRRGVLVRNQAVCFLVSSIQQGGGRGLLWDRPVNQWIEGLIMGVLLQSVSCGPPGLLTFRFTAARSTWRHLPTWASRPTAATVRTKRTGVTSEDSVLRRPRQRAA